jgi:hypothetical protein
VELTKWLLGTPTGRRRRERAAPHVEFESTGEIFHPQMISINGATIFCAKAEGKIASYIAQPARA